MGGASVLMMSASLHGQPVDVKLVTMLSLIPRLLGRKQESAKRNQQGCKNLLCLDKFFMELSALTSKDHEADFLSFTKPCLMR